MEFKIIKSKMKLYEVETDRGSVLFGNKDYQVEFDNGFGSGITLVVVNDIEDYNEDDIDELTYLGNICGNFNLYKDDTSYSDDNILEKFNACYYVYQMKNEDCGVIVLLKL